MAREASGNANNPRVTRLGGGGETADLWQSLPTRHLQRATYVVVCVADFHSTSTPGLQMSCGMVHSEAPTACATVLFRPRPKRTFLSHRFSAFFNTRTMECWRRGRSSLSLAKFDRVALTTRRSKGKDQKSSYSAAGVHTST